MARIVFYNLPAYGHVNPTLALVERLVAEGDTVYYYTGERFNAIIEEKGGQHRTYPASFSLNLSLLFHDMYRLAYEVLKEGTELLSPLEVELKAIQPDLIIHDAVCFWGKVLAQRNQIPAICSQPFMIFAEAGSPYREVLKGWKRKMLGRSWLYYLGFLYLRWRKKLQVLMPQVEQMFNHTQSLTLVYTSDYFQPNAAHIPDTYAFIGPAIPAYRGESDFPMAQFKSKKTVFVSLGTLVSQFGASFFRLCIEAFAQTDWHLIIATGALEDIDQLGAIPDNVTLRPFVPQLLVLPKVDLFISHAGMNSLHEGMYFEVPMLYVPQTFEQHLNALRAQELGVGMLLAEPGETLGIRQLRTAIDEIQGHSAELKAQLARVRASFEAAGGIEEALASVLRFKALHGIRT